MSSAGSLSGELLGILDGKVRFKAAFSPEPLEMTLDTVARINLADTELEKPKPAWAMCGSPSPTAVNLRFYWKIGGRIGSPA